MEPSISKRLPRFKRVSSPNLPFRLQDRDLDILRLFNDYRFLTSRLIHLLTPGSNQGITRRLQKLFHNGHLDRIKNSFYEPCLYALGNKGADELTLHGMDRGKINWTTKNREAKERYINHSMMIANFRATLTLALENNPDTKIIEWIPEGELKENIYIQGDGGKKRASFVPDAYFALEDKEDELHFFLEADQSTMTNQRFLNKMRTYWNYWKEGRHKEKQGIESFRVLTITKTEARKENLRRITKEADDNKTGSVMFWFTSEENYNPENPETILKPIWQTPKDDSQHQLLE